MSAPHLYFVTGEASGDLLARETIEALRTLAPNVDISGVGGAEMAAAGVSTPGIDTGPLAVLGLLEGVLAYRDVVRLADAVASDILAKRPDAVVLVDSWGFSLRVAHRVRAANPDIRLIKLVGPQVWASRPGRAKTLARAVDHLLCLFPNEPGFYEPHGLSTTVIGHPALARTRSGDGAAFRRARGWSADAPILLVLPGSRPSEIRRVAPTLVAAALRLQAEMPGLKTVYAPATPVAAMFRDRFSHLSASDILASDGGGSDAMAAADVALACSGTVTIEAALQGAAVVTGYKVGWVTWALVKMFRLIKTPYISLVNVLAGSDISPEFVQLRFTPTRLAEAARVLLTQPTLRQAQCDAQFQALKAMGQGRAPPAEAAARAILAMF